ncbi:MAG: PAS domain-containing protein [Pseudomonadota bacterium]|nr:PAS domain-containing protein [Pseudomonadota bacterium]
MTRLSEDLAEPPNPHKQGKRRYDKVILRLVRNRDEWRAIDAGEIDAIVDSVSGKAILLPDAQLALLQRGSFAHGRLAPSSEPTWEWQQDAAHRFLAPDSGRFCEQPINGKALWDLAINTVGETSWQAHRQQLEWRAAFSDLEISCIDWQGTLHYFSLDGEPVHDAAGQFIGYRGITREITERKQLEIGSLDPARAAIHALDALPHPTSVLDADGTVLIANQSWRTDSGTRTGISVGVGSSFLAACADADDETQVDATAISAGLRQIIAGTRTHFQYPVSRATASGRAALTLRICGISEIGSAARAVVSLEDSSEHRHAEQLLQLERDVARGLLAASSADVGLVSTMQTLCETMRWDCGRYFRLDTDAGLLRFESGWGRKDAIVELFLEQSRTLAFRPGAGLAGRAFASAQPLWTAAAASGKDASVLPPETGDSGSFVLPVTFDGRTTGVMAFSAENVREPDERMLQSMHAIATMLGRFLQSQLATEALRASEARFRRLTAISSDWFWEQDQAFRFVRISQNGLDESHPALGKTLWELPAMASGICWHELKAHVAARWSFCDFEYAVASEEGQLRYYSISGEPVYSESGEFTGYCGTGLDITRRKRAQIALQESALTASR